MHSQKEYGKIRSIFIVEDSDHDSMLIERAFNKVHIAYTLKRFECGESLLEYIYNKSDAKEMETPSLIILDINLPGISGLEVLAKLRKEVGVEHTPIILFSTSAHSKDVEAGYRLGANTYFTKPFDFDDYCYIISNITKYWFSCAILTPDYLEH